MRLLSNNVFTRDQQFEKQFWELKRVLETSILMRVGVCATCAIWNMWKWCVLNLFWNEIISNIYGHPLWGEKWVFAHPGNWDYEPKIFRKSEVRSLIRNDWFNSCIGSLFACMALTLYKSQVHYSGLMQWCVCSSIMSILILQRQVAKLASVLFHRWSLLRNNHMATNLQRFTSNNGRRRFAACDCWTQ